MTNDRKGNGAAAGGPERGQDPVDERLRGEPRDAEQPPTPTAITAPPGEGVVRIILNELRVPAAVLTRELRELHRHSPDLVPRAKRALAAIEQQARAIEDLASSLRELEPIDHAESPGARRPVDVGAVVTRVVGDRSAEVAAAGLRLELVAGEGPVLLPGDPERLGHAVGLVVDTLRRALPRGGTIRVLLQGTADGARIDVEALPGTDRRPRRRARLRGTPLAIARRIAAFHGGGLEVVHGEGRTSVRLALRTVLQQASDADARRGETTRLGRARILVVDDDQDAREALSMLLGDDHEVLLAADGHEAIQRSIEERPDVVLMDLYMPRMDGLAALEALRAEPVTEGLPVILISARGDELTRSRCLDLGAVDFLQKPFSGRELKARIERTLRLTRRETELQALARTDPLTGLANLRAFRIRLDDEVKRARRYRTSLACVMVDMDHLKPINDELGHAAGDQAIRAVADVLRNELRETDFGARYGGDEFVLLLPHTSGAEARVFAERVCARLSASPLELDGTRIPLGASFGIAALVDEPVDRPGEALVRRADAALYAAKRGGRGRVAAHPSAAADPATQPS